MVSGLDGQELGLLQLQKKVSGSALGSIDQLEFIANTYKRSWVNPTLEYGPYERHVIVIGSLVGESQFHM